MVKVLADASTIYLELERRGVAYRIGSRAAGFFIPVVGDPEENMIELYPNVGNVSLPRMTLCPPEQFVAALVEVREPFKRLSKNLEETVEVPLLLFEMQQQQQQ